MGLWENLPIKNHCLTLTLLLRNVVAVTKDKGPYSQSYGLCSSSVQMWELDHKEGWALKGWCFQIVEKILETPLDSKEIKPVSLKADQPWMFTWRTNAETSIFWSSDVNSWLIGKVLDAGKDRGQKERRASEDEMAGWHHWCSGHELGKTLGDDEGQRGLMCCSPWCCKELDTIGQLNNNNNKKWFAFSLIVLCISVLSFVTSL